MYHARGACSVPKLRPCCCVGGQDLREERGAGVDRLGADHQGVILHELVHETGIGAGDVGAVIVDDAGQAAVAVAPTRLGPVVAEIEGTGRIEHRQAQAVAGGADADEAIALFRQRRGVVEDQKRLEDLRDALADATGGDQEVVQRFRFGKATWLPALRRIYDALCVEIDGLTP